MIATKPQVEIFNAALVPVWGGYGATNDQVLEGTCGEYPEGHGNGARLSGQEITTSRVVHVSEDKTTVETRNTVYLVRSWKSDEL